jgi:hypothetical protein
MKFKSNSSSDKISLLRPSSAFCRNGPAEKVVRFSTVFSALLLIAALPVRAAVPGPGGSSPIATIDASFFISDLPISSLLGFLALVGLLWLGKKKKVSDWDGEKAGMEKKKVRWWQSERLGREKARFSAFCARFSALGSRFAGKQLRPRDPAELEEVRQRIEKHQDGIIDHPPLRRGSTGSSASTDID